jgi:ribonuclease HI
MIYERPTTGIVVDGSCKGNPGPIQWQTVDLTTGELLHVSKPFDTGTNNIAEYLAIIHALSVTSDDSPLPYIYTDSQTAIWWLIKTKRPTHVSVTPLVEELINKAHNWLTNHRNSVNRVRKWESKLWGENPADFNRK